MVGALKCFERAFDRATPQLDTNCEQGKHNEIWSQACRYTGYAQVGLVN